MGNVGLHAQTACTWEATARKPGNVHRFVDFADLHYLDLLLSAAALAPVLDRAGQQSVGRTILEAVNATRQVVATNSNLGIILLLSPLAAVAAGEDLQAGVSRVLGALGVDDARLTYQAIRLAAPGGLGEVDEQDVAKEPTLGLVEVMALSAQRDLIAAQYANGFRDLFRTGVPALQRGLGSRSLETAIIGCHLHLLAEFGDSLIQRKRGMAEAAACRQRAQGVLAAGWPDTPAAWQELHSFDAWLRESRRNPGTTADLVAACLFIALRTGTIQLPPQLPWTAELDL